MHSPSLRPLFWAHTSPTCPRHPSQHTLALLQSTLPKKGKPKPETQTFSSLSVSPLLRFLAPVTSSSPRKVHSAPLASPFIMQPICGPKPTHTLQQKTEMSQSSTVLLSAHLRSALQHAQQGLLALLRTTSPSKTFYTWAAPPEGLQAAAATWAARTQLSYHQMLSGACRACKTRKKVSLPPSYRVTRSPFPSQHQHPAGFQAGQGSDSL